MVIRTFVCKQSAKEEPILNVIPLDEERERINLIRAYGYDPTLSDEELKLIKVSSHASLINAHLETNINDYEDEETLDVVIKRDIESKRQSIDNVNNILKQDYERARELWETGFTEVYRTIEIQDKEEDLVKAIEESKEFVKWVDRVEFNDTEINVPTSDIKIEGFIVGHYIVLCDVNNEEHMEYVQNHPNYIGLNTKSVLFDDDSVISVVQLQLMDSNSNVNSKISNLFDRIYDPENSETVKSPFEAFDPMQQSHFQDREIRYVDNSSVLDAENLEDKVKDMFKFIDL